MGDGVPSVYAPGEEDDRRPARGAVGCVFVCCLFCRIGVCPWGIFILVRLVDRPQRFVHPLRYISLSYSGFFRVAHIYRRYVRVSPC